MPIQIQLRRGTATQWTTNNPVLASGELGLETDTSKIKIGTGSGAWTSLPYAISSGVAVGDITGLGTGVATFLATPSSANLASAVTDETGSGSLVFATSPSLTTPTLGIASATSINKVAITAPASSATLTIADGKTLTASNTLTFTGTDSSSVAFGAGGTVAYTSNNLGVFASTTSSQLAGVISDETGSGSLVFATSPTLTTPTVDQINASAAGATVSLYSSLLTTGTLNIGGALTTGTLNIAAAGTSATNINIGHTNALVGITGNTTVTGTLTSTSTIQGTTGTLTGSTLAINGSSPTISSSSASAASIFTGTVTGITLGSSSITTTLYPSVATTATGTSGAGYMGMPQNSTTTGSYRLVADDAGKHIYSTATRTITIPGNATGGSPQVAFPIGSTIVFANATGTTLTLQMDGTTTDTCLLAGAGTSMTGGSGTRTLAAFGMATLLKITATSWLISGNGLT